MNKAMLGAAIVYLVILTGPVGIFRVIENHIARRENGVFYVYEHSMRELMKNISLNVSADCESTCSACLAFIDC
jgi:hypothetical protein